MIYSPNGDYETGSNCFRYNIHQGVMKMSNRQPEQDLINGFVRKIREDAPKICIHNCSCWHQTFADIEITLPSGQRWAIEAKSHKSNDSYNTIHKLFGELLKETGRDERDNCNIGVLIPECGIDFYKDGFRKIRRCKFVCFGILIPVRYVFSYGVSGVRHTFWDRFYDQGFSESFFWISRNLVCRCS